MTSPALLSISSSDTTITLHFDRNVFAGDGSIVVSDGYGQTYMSGSGLSTRIVGATDKRVISSTDSSVLSYSGQDIVVHLGTPLKNGLSYSITMTNAAVIDSGADGNARISSPSLFKFTATGSATTIPAPSAVIGSTIHFTDTGSDTSDYITALAAQVVTGTYTGTVGTKDFIQVSLDNGASWHQASVNATDHTWSYSGEINSNNLTEGSDGLNGTLLARISNSSGGNSGTASHTYVYNNHPLEIGVSSTFSLSDDTGTSSSDRITNTAVQTISGSYSGTLETGMTLQVSVDGGANWINASASAGSWHTTGTVTLNAGSNQLQARVIDIAGNSSSVASASYKLLTSTVSLSGHALTLPESADGGVSSGDGITASASKVTLNVAGLRGFHAGDTIQIVDTSHGSAVVGSYVIVDTDLYYGDNYFSVSKFDAAERTTTVDVNLGTLTDGAHTLAARILDVAGNTGVVSATTTVTIDTTAPVLSASSPLENATGVSTGLTELTFTFNENIAIANGTVVTITDNSNSNNFQEITLSSSAASGNTLTIHLSSALTSGTSYTVMGAIVTDLANNAGVTGDTPLLHFTTAGTYVSALTLGFVDTAPLSDRVSGPSESTDGITNNKHISVEGVSASATWYYSTNSADTWTLGSGTGFDLEDGTYSMGKIQVKQTVGGFDSAISYIHQTVVVDTTKPVAVVEGTVGFNSGASSINGTFTSTSDFSNEIVEITFDHGVSWTRASTESSGASDAATWALSGIAASLGNNYGVRLSDKAGNLAEANSGNPLYYLANGGVTFNHASDHYSHVVGGTGADTISLGNHAVVQGGDNDTVSTLDDAFVTVGNSATVTTGNGNNLVIAGSGATISTGTGADNIKLNGLGSARLIMGTGDDTLSFLSDTSLSLSALSKSSGIDNLYFGSNGTNALTILSSASVHNLSDNDRLAITYSGVGTTTVSLDSLVWHADGTSGSYTVYHDSTSTIAVLIGTGITVNLVAFSA